MRHEHCFGPYVRSCLHWEVDFSHQIRSFVRYGGSFFPHARNFVRFSTSLEPPEASRAGMRAADEGYDPLAMSHEGSRVRLEPLLGSGKDPDEGAQATYQRFRGSFQGHEGSRHPRWRVKAGD